MADPRRYIGVRISEQGHFYIKLVAERDRINYSEALRRLLALGAKTDMEAHDNDSRNPQHSAARSAHALHVRSDDDRDRDLDSDRSSGEVSRLPDPGRPAGIGDAIGALVRGGLNPSTLSEEDDGPSAA